MSGPKVVRVVTREERIDTCETLLRQLDAAISSLKKTAKRFDDTKAHELVEMTQRRSTLRELVANDRFDEAEQSIRQEIAFYQAEKERTIVRATQAATSARAKSLRQRITAQMLLEKIVQQTHGEHQGMLDQLRAIAKTERHTDEADRVLAAATRLVTTVDSRGASLSSNQQALANALKGTEVASGPEGAWRVPVAQDQRLVALQERLSQIEVLKDNEATSQFSSRLMQLETEPDTPARSMRIDALVLDVVSAADAIKADAELFSNADLLLSELAAPVTAEEEKALQARLSKALESRNIQQVRELTTDATEAIAQARRRVAATARRDAILSGLASLGYQVNESMATSWVEQGRVVLQKPGQATHGLEIASPADAQRLQLRAVAFSESRPSSSDLAAETTWCGEFGKLQTLLAQQSSQLIVEKALPVGAVPLKVVQSTSLGSTQVEEVRHSVGRHR